MSVLLGHTLLPQPAAASASPATASGAATAVSGAASTATAPLDAAAFMRHREAENRALREQCQALRLLLDAREAQATEHYALLQARIQEGEQLWLQLAIQQEQLYRCTHGLEPTLLATPAPTGAVGPGASPQEERCVASTVAPGLGDEEGIDSQAALEPGTPNSRHVLSLLSVTPAPTLGTYYGNALEAWGQPAPADSSAPLPSPAPTPSSHGFGLAASSPLPSPTAAPLPSPSPGAPPQAPLMPSCQLPIVPSPPRHPAPVQSLDFSPEKVHAAPPEREAFEGMVSDEPAPYAEAPAALS